MATIQGIYIALFGRPADPLGLDYFNDVTNDGQDLSQIGNLAGQPEYLERFEGQSNAEIVTQIYNVLFGRNPEAAGLAFFVAQLNSGAQTINTIAINILDGAEGPDADIVAAKEAAADQFTAAVRADPDALAAYSGDEGKAFGMAFLDQIDSGDDELTDAEVAAQIDTFVETGAVPGVDPDAPTNQVNFTDAVGENLVGTSANDAFNGVIANNNANSTVNVGDTVNGGAGVDTLNLLVTGGDALPAGFASNAVEIVNVTTAGNGAIAGLNSASFGGVEQLWQIDNVAGANGTFGSVTVASGVTAGFRSNGTVAVANTVDVIAASATQASISVAIEGVATLSTLDFVGAGLKTIDVSGNVFNAAGATEQLVFTNNATNLDAINISLTGATEIFITNGGALTAETINLAGSTGGITLDLTAANNSALSLTSLVGGTGNDVLTLAAADLSAATATVNGGAGNDTISIDIDNAGAGTATALTVSGGAGADTFDFDSAAVGNLVAAGSAADLTASLITVTDFDGAVDVLNTDGLTGVTPLEVQNDVNAAVAGAADLFAAATAVAGVTSADEFALFEFGGNTYVYGDTGAGVGLDAGDTLIQLTGVSISDLSPGTNFVA